MRERHARGRAALIRLRHGGQARYGMDVMCLRHGVPRGAGGPPPRRLGRFGCGGCACCTEPFSDATAVAWAAWYFCKKDGRELLFRSRYGTI